MARNEGYEYRERIPARPEAGPETLLDYLARRHRHSSRDEWRERIRAGLVLLDSQAAPAEALVRPGQWLAWRRPPWVEPDAPPGLAVLFEDEELLAVAKPAGLPTLPGAGFLQETLLHRLRRLTPEASPLHRLGRWTSGVVLCARTRAARAELSRQWASREIGKRYRAIASGRPAQREFTVAIPIGPVPHPLLGSVHAASPDGRPASTIVTVLEWRPGEFLCDARIATGRPHQVRIHLAAAGHPLAGDPLYVAGGRPAPDTRSVPGDPGYWLHAAELTFRHPFTHRPMTVACEPPAALLWSGEDGPSPAAQG